MEDCFFAGGLIARAAQTLFTKFGGIRSCRPRPCKISALEIHLAPAQ